MPKILTNKRYAELVENERKYLTMVSRVAGMRFWLPCLPTVSPIIEYLNTDVEPDMIEFRKLMFQLCPLGYQRFKGKDHSVICPRVINFNDVFKLDTLQQTVEEQLYKDDDDRSKE